MPNAANYFFLKKVRVPWKCNNKYRFCVLELLIHIGVFPYFFLFPEHVSFSVLVYAATRGKEQFFHTVYKLTLMIVFSRTRYPGIFWEI